MGRQTSIMGLNDWATKLVSQTETVKEVGSRFWKGGKHEEFEREVKILLTIQEINGEFEGMFGEKYPLKKYTLPNGLILQEYVQAGPWSSGPIIFLALKEFSPYEGHNKWRVLLKSLWSDEEINNA